MNSSNIGTYYQGQILCMTLTSSEDATSEEKAMLEENDLYVGIYNPAKNTKKILSTADGSIVKQVNSSTGVVTLAFILSATDTKVMDGSYVVEMLIKNSDNSFTSPSANMLTFHIEPRKLAEVIK